MHHLSVCGGATRLYAGHEDQLLTLPSRALCVQTLQEKYAEGEKFLSTLMADYKEIKGRLEVVEGQNIALNNSLTVAQDELAQMEGRLKVSGCSFHASRQHSAADVQTMHAPSHSYGDCVAPSHSVFRDCVAPTYCV
jgi:hypothetical protein